MKLIDKQALIETMSGHVISMSVCLSKDERDGMERMYNTLMNDIEKAPTVDAEPVKHGRWIPVSEPDDNDNVISCCSICSHSDDQCTSIHVPYCWFCGAKMDVETE